MTDNLFYKTCRELFVEGTSLPFLNGSSDIKDLPENLVGTPKCILRLSFLYSFRIDVLRFLFISLGSFSFFRYDHPEVC